MMFLMPLRTSRPSRITRGGTVGEVLAADARTIYADPIIQEGALIGLTVAAEEDVRIGDIIEIPTNLGINVAQAQAVAPEGMFAVGGGALAGSTVGGESGE